MSVLPLWQEKREKFFGWNLKRIPLKTSEPRGIAETGGECTRKDAGHPENQKLKQKSGKDLLQFLNPLVHLRVAERFCLAKIFQGLSFIIFLRVGNTQHLIGVGAIGI